jgi:hypothetical protein
LPRSFEFHKDMRPTQDFSQRHARALYVQA